MRDWCRSGDRVVISIAPTKRAQPELAATIAHGVKNPLAALRSYAQILAGCEEPVGAAALLRFEKALRIIQEESDRIDGHA